MTEVLTLIIEPATTLVIDPDLGPQPVPAGAPGQIVSYGPDGALIAMDLPPSAGGAIAWTDISGLPAAFPPAAHRHDASEIDNLPAPAWATISDRPASFPPVAHIHQMTEIDGLQAALEGKATSASVLTTEQLQDLVAAMFQGGTQTGASVAYDDAAGTISITAAVGGPAMTQEEVEDFVGGLVMQGTGISVSYDDAGNVLRIALSGESYSTADRNKLAAIAPGATVNATDAALRDRASHTGLQPISSVAGLQAALDAKQPATSFKTVNGTAIVGSGDITIPAGPAGTSVQIRSYTVLADAQAAQATYPNDIIVLKDP